jgi:hypothetical protein
MLAGRQLNWLEAMFELSLSGLMPNIQTEKVLSWWAFGVSLNVESSPFTYARLFFARFLLSS